jgi:hypothetical protein
MINDNANPSAKKRRRLDFLFLPSKYVIIIKTAIAAANHIIKSNEKLIPTTFVGIIKLFCTCCVRHKKLYATEKSGVHVKIIRIMAVNPRKIEALKFVWFLLFIRLFLPFS